MDPITLYFGLYDLSSSLATIVNVGLNTKAGRETLDSTLRELPILFSLVEEMKAGVLKSPTTIPRSTTLAFEACQAALNTLIHCLSQRGLMGAWQNQVGFSKLQQRLSNRNMENQPQRKESIIEKVTGKGKAKENEKEKGGLNNLKEMFHLSHVDALNKAVESFKNSVLFLRSIAGDFHTHSILHSQLNEQQIIINELKSIRSMLGNSINTDQKPHSFGGASENAHSRSPNSRQDESRATYASADGLLPQRSGTWVGRPKSRESSPAAWQGRKGLPSEQPPLEVEVHPTRFDLLLSIPREITDDTSVPKKPFTVFAKGVLDTGSARNMISMELVIEHKFEYLVETLKEKKTWTLGDGKGKMSSNSIVTLTWYNTHDAMRTYTTVFYVTESEIWDVIIGEEFYKKHGAPYRDPDEKWEMMGGRFETRWRPKEERTMEKKKEEDNTRGAWKKIIEKRQRAATQQQALPPKPTQQPIQPAQPIQGPQSPSQNDRVINSVPSNRKVFITAPSDVTPLDQIIETPEVSKSVVYSPLDITELQPVEGICPPMDTELVNPKTVNDNVAADLVGGSSTSHEESESLRKEGGIGNSRASSASSQKYIDFEHKDEKRIRRKPILSG